MKKNYSNPIVGAEEFLISNQALCTSPGAGISGGGSTGSGGPGLPGGSDPIPGN